MLQRLSIIFITISLIFLVACAESVDDDTAEHYSSLAKQIIENLNAGEYEAVSDLFSDELISEIEDVDISDIEPLIRESGEFEGFEDSKVQSTEAVKTNDTVFVTVTTVAYSEIDRKFTISFNKHDELVGLDAE